MRILFVGDVVGKPGRQILAENLSTLQSDWKADFTVVNVENAAGGKGITAGIADEILALGANVLTTGNHVWAQRGVEEYLASEPRILRPLNFPDDAPGVGIFRGRSRQGEPVAVVMLQGRVFMQPIECPFHALDDALLQKPQNFNLKKRRKLTDLVQKQCTTVGILDFTFPL